MYTANLIAAGAAVAANLATAAPTVAASQCPKGTETTSYNANFDDLTGIPGTATNAIKVPYKGLYYQGFQFADVLQTNLLPGPVPHSSPNYAVADVISEASGTPMITTNYQGGPAPGAELFSPKSLYFSCTIQAGNGATDPSTACDISITGYRGPDNSVSTATQVCSQQFQYNPTSAIGVQQQAFGQFNAACSDLNFLLIQFSLPGGEAALDPTLALELDDFKYDLYTCKA